MLMITAQQLINSIKEVTPTWTLLNAIKTKSERPLQSDNEVFRLRVSPLPAPGVRQLPQRARPRQGLLRGRVRRPGRGPRVRRQREAVPQQVRRRAVRQGESWQF